MWKLSDYFDYSKLILCREWECFGNIIIVYEYRLFVEIIYIIMKVWE